MKTAWTLVAIGICLPMAAAAQGNNDARYCAELIRLYRTYVNNPDDPRPTFDSPISAHETAIHACQTGNTAAGIPPLEKALRDIKLTLPPRG